MKTIQAKLIKQGEKETVNQPEVDLVVAHVEHFRVVRVAQTVYAYTCSGNTYVIEGQANIERLSQILE